MPKLYSDFWGLPRVAIVGSVFLAVAYGLVLLFLYWGLQEKYAAIAGVLIGLPLVAFIIAAIDEVRCRRAIRKSREWRAEQERKREERAKKAIEKEKGMG